MTFNSWEFLIFYPVVALLYFLLPKKLKWPMLLVASYYFYMCYQAELVFLIVGTTLVSWIASRIIEKSEDPKVRKLWLTVTLIVCLGVLFFYKYFNFLADSAVGLIRLFGGEPEPIVLDLILPVGISFYTFQTLSYVIDVYRGSIRTEKNFFFYALFVSFFPQLVAGPIERPENLIPQLREPHPWNNDNAIKGAKHMIVGFFKKVVVADLISVYVDSVYNHADEASGLGVVIATALFAVQIYCDFSGYTDIAIGCARIMGIRLMQNFNHPYMATSIKEFWNRWHISLSTWFRDYLYFPLGGSRCKKWRHLMNLMIVFLVSGLWHGANWTYVIWGAIHGLYQVIGQLTIKPRNALLEKIGLSTKHPVVIWVRRVITFILADFAWLFFRANTVGEAGVLVGKLFTGWNLSFFVTPKTAANSFLAALKTIISVPFQIIGQFLGYVMDSVGMSPVSLCMTVLSILTLIMIDRLLTYDDSPDGSAVLTKNGAFVLYIWMILFAWAILLSKDMTSTFIYFQF